LALSAAAHATSVTVTDRGEYSYAVTTYQNPTPTTVQTHVIGVYETDSSHSGGYHPTGVGRVEIKGDVTQPINLVLSAYEPTNWVLYGEGLGAIASVLINGYHDGSVSGIDASKVIDRSGPGQYLSACAYRWPDDNQGCNTPALISGVEAHYGTPVTSFTGIYHGKGFVVSASPVPEASSLVYLLLGAPAAVWAARQRRKA
jgi:hypothetical protein